MNDERLRDAYARVLEERGGDRDGCPSLDEIVALVRRDGAEASRLTTLDHVMGCPRCQREFELLRAVDEAGGAEARSAAPHPRWQRWVPMALAASLVLAVGVIAGDRLRRGDVDPLRAGGDDVVLASPADGATVERATPVVLAWRPVRGAGRYAVELLTVDGALAFEGETADTTLIVAAPLAPGEYRWLVRAQAADATERRSAARALRVRDE